MHSKSSKITFLWFLFFEIVSIVAVSYVCYKDIGVASEKADYSIQMQDTGKRLVIKIQDDKKTTQSYSAELYYNKDTELVYYNVDRESSFNPYMKNSSTQYKWDIKTKRLK